MPFDKLFSAFHRFLYHIFEAWKTSLLNRRKFQVWLGYIEVDRQIGRYLAVYTYVCVYIYIYIYIYMTHRERIFFSYSFNFVLFPSFSCNILKLYDNLNLVCVFALFCFRLHNCRFEKGIVLIFFCLPKKKKDLFLFTYVRVFLEQTTHTCPFTTIRYSRKNPQNLLLILLAD